MTYEILKGVSGDISVWDKLKNPRKPIVMYGMGDGADKILDYCELNKIKIYDIFASDEFVRGHSFRGYKVKKFDEIQEKLDDFIILVAFATRDRKVLDKIYEFDKKYELYAPDMPVFGDKFNGGYYDYLLENVKEFSQVYELLADDKSKQVYLDVINFKISGKIKYLQNADTPKSEVISLLHCLETENLPLNYIDLGAYDGDSILELNKYLRNINKIIAVEPDAKNFIKLQKNLEKNNLTERCSLYNIGIWSEKQDIYFSEKAGRHSSVVMADSAQNSRTKIKKIAADSVDNIVESNKSDGNHRYFIKYDVEGSEYEAIIGSSATIKKHSPSLAVSLYHRNEDLIKLPGLINMLNPSYKFYLRKHEYIPCWDLNLYAIYLP